MDNGLKGLKADRLTDEKAKRQKKGELAFYKI